jgi:uncharacterized protein YbaP (TraB family)
VIYRCTQLKLIVGELVSVKQQLEETHQVRKEMSELEVQLNRSIESKNVMVKQLEHYEVQLQSLPLLVEENKKLKTENEFLLQKDGETELLKEKMELYRSNTERSKEMVSAVVFDFANAVCSVD